LGWYKNSKDTAIYQRRSNIQNIRKKNKIENKYTDNKKTNIKRILKGISRVIGK